MTLLEPESTRIRLRQWQAADFAPFARLNADPQVMEYFPASLSTAESDALAARCQALIAERGWSFWAAELKATGAFLGFVGLHNPSAALPCSPCVEVGWRLAREHWGKGYATEAARAALRTGFEALALPEIVAFTTLGNLRSQAVMQRLGMVRDGTFVHPALPQDSPLREHCLYRITRAQFAAQGERLHD